MLKWFQYQYLFGCPTALSFSLTDQSGVALNSNDKFKMVGSDLHLNTVEAWNGQARLNYGVGYVDIDVRVLNSGSQSTINSITSALVPLEMSAYITAFNVDLQDSIVNYFTLSMPSVQRNQTTLLSYSVVAASVWPVYLSFDQNTKSFKISKSQLLNSGETRTTVPISFKVQKDSSTSQTYSFSINIQYPV